MTPPNVASNQFYPKGNPLYRLFALWYFCLLMIAWNIVGRTHLGFEQSWMQWFAALGVAGGMQVLLEVVDAWSKGRPLRFAGASGTS